MAETPPPARGRRTTEASRHLRDLAAWYREFAERTDNSMIWEARLRTAQDLDTEAERIEASLNAVNPASARREQNAKVAALRAEAHRLVGMATAVSDIQAKQRFAARALALSQRAEAIARSQEDPAIVEANIERYRKMLAAGIDDPEQRRTVEEMLDDAEAVLAILRDTAP
jgi:hypothetical protein